MTAVDVKVVADQGVIPPGSAPAACVPNFHNIIYASAFPNAGLPDAPWASHPAEMQQRECGVVKTWLPERGYGFLKPNQGGMDVYVHKSQLPKPGPGLSQGLRAGDKVSFQRQVGHRGGYQATQVSVLSSGNLFRDLPLEPSVANGHVGLPLLLGMAGEQETPELLNFLEPFVLRSSLGCPFIVLSDTEVVEGIDQPTQQDFCRLLMLARGFLARCGATYSTLLVDFEGEMPGHGGEISIAQLQYTAVLDPRTLAARRLNRNQDQRFQSPGFLIDLRSPLCIELIRQVMEDPFITKILWGANGDCQCLMYQQRPRPLGIRPQRIIDAQVAFDNQNRIGMAKMLGQVPNEIKAGLPTKEDQIKWDFFHCKNDRALSLPLSRQSALYAVDDLHRIEAILGSKQPPSGSYAGALHLTSTLVQDLCDDPFGMKTLEQDLRWLEKRDGTKRSVKAVQILRHCNSISLRGAPLDKRQTELFATAKAQALQALENNVEVRMDMSFNNDDVALRASVSTSPNSTGSLPVLLEATEVYQ
ncbi:unnamed protein product [Effrenium voratum]|nr:unnamed protein product [Effrenium voratum]